jgi:hypothetical protein
VLDPEEVEKKLLAHPRFSTMADREEDIDDALYRTFE